MSHKVEAIKKAVFYAHEDPLALANVIAGLVTDVVTSVKISGATSVVNDTTLGTTSTYSAKVFSQYEDEMSGQTITFSLKAAVTGVSVDSSSGVATITKDVTDGTKFTVVATCSSKTDEIEVTVVVES